MEPVRQGPDTDDGAPQETAEAHALEVEIRSVPKQKAKTCDRVALDRDEVQRLSKWLLQITESTNGFLVLSRSDLVNFLIRSHHDELTSKEIAQISSHHYDPLRHIAWIAPQIKVALESGDFQRMAKLQDELRNVKLTSAKNYALEQEDSVTAEMAKKRARKSAKLEPENVISPTEIKAEKP